MEDPGDLSRPDVKSPNITRCGRIGLGVASRENQEVVVDDARGVGDDEQVRHVATGVQSVVQIDDSRCSEGVDESTGVGLEGKQF